MGITCPTCGGTSHDPEFCDHCNAELAPPALPLPPPRCPLTPDFAVSLRPEQIAMLSHPEASVLLEAAGQRWRVHWIGRGNWETWQPYVTERLTHASPVLPTCRVVQDRTGVWVMAEVNGQHAEPWLSRPSDPLGQLRFLVQFLVPFADALEGLHSQGLIWLTFNPTEIEVLGRWAPHGQGPAPGPELRFTNMDLRVYPAGSCPEQLQVMTTFAAPEVWRFEAAELGPRTDVYHLALFAYYWLAGLLPDGFPGSGLEAFHFLIPPLRTFTPGLPPGVNSVLARGLEIEPQRRQESPAALCADLQHVLERAERRWSASAPLHWEIGGHTRAGRTKSALGRANEDTLLVRRFSDPERALLAVADGISVCDVGSGVLASWMACLILETELGSDCNAVSFPQKVVAACHRGAAGLLAWALERGHGHLLEEGRHLMGTTLVAAWLEGNRLQLANLGDSRAYLVAPDGCEQLTVDADVASGLLAMRMPPEDVQALGNMGKALRECVGGFTRDGTGALGVQEQTCTPTLSSWPLVPGDVLVLCSDGLVEEGTFLDPAEMASIVRSRPELSAQALALLLAEAADGRQRTPSPSEPEGFGDNITCIVVKCS